MHTEIGGCVLHPNCECDLQRDDLEVTNAKVVGIQRAVSTSRVVSTVFVVSIEIECGGMFKVLLASFTLIEGVYFDASCLLGH